MKTLAIDTTGPVVGVAAADGARVAVRYARVGRDVEAVLLDWVVEVCAELGFGVADVEGVAVAVGPGAFTGLRVGLSTAIGLALARGVPMWAGSSLVSRGLRVAEPGRVLSMLDARKQRVYASVVEDGGERVGPEDVAPQVAVGWMTAPFVATGEGALVYRDVVEAAGGVVAADAEHPAVDVLARLGAEALARGEGVAATDITPVYVREPDARPRAGGST